MIDFANSKDEEHRGHLAINVSGDSQERDDTLRVLTMAYRQARLFKNINLDKLEYTTLDGWNKLGPAYDA